MSLVENKMKFLLIKAAQMTCLLSSNMLLYMYEYGKSSCKVRNCCIDDIYDSVKIDTLLKNNDIDDLRDYIFGKEMGGLVDLYINEMYVGTKANGIKIKAVYNFDDLIRFEEDTVGEELELDNKDDRLKMKLSLAGKRVTCGFFKSGVVCNDLQDLKYVPKERCIALGLNQETVSINDRQFNNLYTSIQCINKSCNVKVSNLVNCSTYLIQRSQLEFHSAILLKSIKVVDSNIVLNNVVLGEFSVIEGSSIKVTGSIHQFGFGRLGIRDSDIQFECDIREDSLLFGTSFHLYNTNVVFKRNVPLFTIKLLIYATLAISAKNNKFKLTVNKEVYMNCKARLDSHYLAYVKEGQW